MKPHVDYRNYLLMTIYIAINNTRIKRAGITNERNAQNHNKFYINLNNRPTTYDNNL